MVQIEPGPTPTFTASTPAFIKSSAASAVAIFPPTKLSSGYSPLICSIVFKTLTECPWAVSTIITSTPASTNAATLSNVSGAVPTAAPTLNLPVSSLQALGCFFLLTISFIVINPFSFPSSSTTGSFSILCFCKISTASSKEVPSFAVTKGAFVINFSTGLL